MFSTEADGIAFNHEPISHLYAKLDFMVAEYSH